MPDFKKLVVRHGDIGAQAPIQLFQRYEGVWPVIGSLLDERWHMLMETKSASGFSAAA